VPTMTIKGLWLCCNPFYYRYALRRHILQTVISDSIKNTV
jgi:hypothetical protein